jgi:hypothetical protein
MDKGYDQTAIYDACEVPASRWIKADRLHTLIPRQSPRWCESLRSGRSWAVREPLRAGSSVLLDFLHLTKGVHCFVDG